MKAHLFRRARSTRPTAPTVLEALEGRTLCYAPVPSTDVRLETIQIRPGMGTYTSNLVLAAGTTYFLQATGDTRTSGNAYHGDAAYLTATTAATSTWGISVVAGSTTLAPSAWGAIQSDHIYGQHVTLKTGGALSFSFANDGLDKISTLAVTVYAPVPAVTVPAIRTDVASGSLPIAALPSQQVFLPLNDADWDHNGIADDQQSGAVVGDKFLLPLTLPAIPGASATTHIQIEAPKGLRVWLNPDRTGSTAGVGLRATSARTVYLEGYAEQPHKASVSLRILFGNSVEQDVPVTVFALAGPATVAGGSKQVYSSNSAEGEWLSAVNGTLDSKSIAHAKGTSYANVFWDDVTTTGYADFEADSDFVWGWPVDVTA